MKRRFKGVLGASVVLIILIGITAALLLRTTPTSKIQVTEVLWMQQLPLANKPSSATGPELDFKHLHGQPLVINFWASWCTHCVHEMPALDRFAKDHASQGWQVVGVAVDRPEAVQRFLQEIPVSFPVVIAGWAGMELMRSLGNASGGLPYTVILNPEGHVVMQKAGAVSTEELRRWAAAMRP
ncbi:TlpA disulfide reductase family protein [Leptothrix ochracea]|uniref:TlpA disulfide reductase family protein n=1 Tax=Leptothrix ochracea TaxID=735331 RepID=UPI0034E1AB6C